MVNVNTQLYLLESPLQLISAKEASLHYKHCKIVSVVRYGLNKRKLHNAHLRATQSFLNIKNPITMPSYYLKILNLLIAIIAGYLLKIRFKNIDTICIGDWRAEWMHIVISIIQPKKIILLDDGIITTNIVEKHLKFGQHNLLAMTNNKSIKSCVKRIILKCTFVATDSNYDLEVFTAYLNTQHTAFLTVTQNTYSNIIDQNTKPLSDDVLYFGTKYSEAGYLSLSSELEYLGKVFVELTTSYSDMEISYVVHRDDSTRKKAEIQKIGFTLKSLNMPAELYMLITDRSPKVVAGASSSVIINANYFSPGSERIIFKLPIKRISKNKLLEVVTMYKSIGTSTRIIDLFES